MGKSERIILLLLSAINFTHILDFMVMMPLGNALMTFFKIDTQRFSLIVSAYSYAAFTSGIVAAFIVDQFDRKRVLLFGYIGFIIATLACGLAPSYQLLILARSVAGFFGGLIGAQVLSIVADTFSYEKRGQAMGYLMAAFSIASVLGVPFSLYLSNLISWHAPFLFIGGLGVLLIPLVMRFLPKMTSHLQEHRDPVSVMQTLGNVFSVPQQQVALLFSSLLMFGHFLIIPFINPYMEFNVGFSINQIPLIYMVGGVVTLFSSPFFGRLADRYGKSRIFLLSGGLALIPVILITNMPRIPFYWVLIVTGFWFAVANGRSVAAQAMISNVVKPQHRGSFMSFNASFQQLFIGSASFVAGLIVTSDASHRIYHYSWVGYLSAAVLTVCLFLPNYFAKHYETPIAAEKE